MAQAILDVDCHLLRDALHLPDTARILYAVQPQRAHTIRLIVESDDFPETKEGDNLPLLSPALTTDRRLVTLSVTLTDWGLR